MIIAEMTESTKGYRSLARLMCVCVFMVNTGGGWDEGQRRFPGFISYSEAETNGTTVSRARRIGWHQA